MRYLRKTAKRKAGAAILLLALFVSLGGRGYTTGKRSDDDTQVLFRENSCRQKILEGAVSFLSPVLGTSWQLQNQDGENILEEKNHGGEEIVGAEATDQDRDQRYGAGSYLQTLLWEEQKRAIRLTGEQQDTETESFSQEQTVAPEDMAEWSEFTGERDADLLAEIDRENEILRQQAVLLQSQQTQQTEGLTGNSSGQEQNNPSKATGIQALTLPYTKEQLANLDFLKKNLYHVNQGTAVSADLLDADTLLAMDMTWEDSDSGGPKILIHHTHATEYFADSDERDEATLIVGVGDYLAELLEIRYGIGVIHDRTVYPYNEAYSKALENVESILEENPTIEVFIDLHRDAGGTKKYTINIEGKETAHLMFFNGLSCTTSGPIDYLPNENQQANLAFSFQMKMAGDSLYPGLCKRNYLKAYRYNLHVLPRAVIVEVGDNNNTLQEAKNAMEALARI